VDTLGQKEAAVRDRTRQIFRFLQTLHDHRNPAKLRIQDHLWFRWFSGFPRHESVERGRREPEANGGPSATEFSLRARRPKLTAAPRPPKDIAEWVEPGWDDPARELTFLPHRKTLDEDGRTVEVALGDDPLRIEARRSWEQVRNSWALAERPARQAMELYEALFTVWGWIERESERVELVLGDGILRWTRGPMVVYHPILLQRVELEFDDSVPEFRVVETNHPVEFYSSAFPAGEDFDTRKVMAFQRELDGGSFHPLGGQDTSDFFRSIAARLSAQAEFVADHPRPSTAAPILGRDPVLFLRSRSQGYTAAIEAILKALERDDPVPVCLAQVVGLEPTDDNNGEPEPSPRPSPSGPNPEILFSKAANPEQFEIARRLATQNSILVQGPPGTGKSHTIANLIGHLLAEGKNVLVTSHTTKALNILRSHVVEELRPLCVSLLESDADSRHQLEAAVNAIVSRLTTSDEVRLRKEGESFKCERARLQAIVDNTEQQLRLAREADYLPIGFGGKSHTPSEAARWVAAGQETQSWIPGPAEAGAPLPLAPDEIRFLYQSNSLLTVAD